MKRILKYAALAAFVAVIALADPASAAVMRGGSCDESHGSNGVTYDCKFNVRDYVQGTPITVPIRYACTGNCGKVVGFSLRDPAFTPTGVMGRLIGGKAYDNGLDLTFVFENVMSKGRPSAATARFSVSVSADDGSGAFSAVPLKVDVHLSE